MLTTKDLEHSEPPVWKMYFELSQDILVSMITSSEMYEGCSHGQAASLDLGPSRAELHLDGV